MDGEDGGQICAFDADERLVSGRFGDFYFSPQEGLAETRHVFLAGNDLPERFARGGDFFLAEAGFGTGLNFLATVDLWRKVSRCGWLRYCAFELYPPDAGILAQTHANWPELAEISALFNAQYAVTIGFKESYHDLAAGWRRLEFPQWRVALDLWIGDINEGLKGVDHAQYAWFLDGFAPDRNPQMWSEAVFSQMSRLSVPQTTAATYSCARIVRESLSANGFMWEKAPGFGRKRFMLRARRAET